MKIFAAIAMVIACGSTWGEVNAVSDKQVVYVAHVGPVKASEVAEATLNGTKLGIADANKMGLQVDGKALSFELLEFDDDGSRDKALEIARGIAGKKGVLAVIGHMGSGTSVAVAPIYAGANIIQVAPTAASPAYSNLKIATAFRANTGDARQGVGLAEFVSKTLRSKRVVLLVQKNAYAEGVASTIEERLQGSGTAIVERLTTSNNPMEVTRNFPAMKNSNADVFLMIGVHPVFEDYVKALRRNGIETNVVLSDGSCVEVFLEKVKDGGSYFCSRNGQPVEKMVLWPSFIEKYRAVSNKLPIAAAGSAYDAVKALAIGVKESNSIDAQVVAKKMHSQDVFAVTGVMSFTEWGELKNGAVSIYRADSGGWLLEEVWQGQ